MDTLYFMDYLFDILNETRILDFTDIRTIKDSQKNILGYEVDIDGSTFCVYAEPKKPSGE